MFRFKNILLLILIICGHALSANGNSPVYVDDNGILRYRDGNKEIHGFGVNYTLPFAHEFRMAQQMGLSHEEIIKQDVYHFARMDMDLYRVHVWDTEISDTLGNLIQNEHLRLFDFAVNEMKKRGIRFIITPIAFWGNGWPERDQPTPGFAHKYGKAGCLTHPDAIKAQENYLFQFLNHVNPFNGIAYKDDADIIAFEISNEPHHGGTREEVTTFINKMSRSMRRTGYDKPIFYNMSHSIHLVDAYLDAEIQGGTFQWYPTNLVANRQINGNFLPHADQYYIPFANHPGFKKMAKIVYEFDPADAGGNYMYAAMARSFREAGMQLGAHFAYDATFFAPYNTNYGTHFMNLAYAPQKAISLKIASAIFNQIPLYKSHGKYPDNTKFGNFRISYEEDLAELVSNEKFFYSNNTSSVPANPSKIKEIAGYGTSPLVSYDGMGAYFIDKIDKGIWRLEVMPDAYWIEDPYSKASPSIQKAAVVHNIRNMKISIADLGSKFSISGINAENTLNSNTENGSFTIRPGVYLLRRDGIKTKINPSQSYKNIRLDEFVAPPSNLNNTVVINHSPMEITAGSTTTLKFNVYAPIAPEKVEVIVFSSRWRRLDAMHKGGATYTVELPSDIAEVGFLNYSIIVSNENGQMTFPNGHAGQPGDWDFAHSDTYSVRVVPQNAMMLLWDAERDWDASLKTWNRNIKLLPDTDGTTSLHIKLDKLPQVVHNSDTISDYTFKFFFRDKIKGRRSDLRQMKSLMISVRTLTVSAQPVEVALIDKNGLVYSTQLDIQPDTNLYHISLSYLNKGKFVIVPRPYPGFMPYFHEAGESVAFSWDDIETLQFSVRQGDQPETSLLLEKIWME